MKVTKVSNSSASYSITKREGISIALVYVATYEKVSSAHLTSHTIGDRWLT